MSSSKNLAEDWLPKSIAECIASLSADESNLKRLPAHLPALKDVLVSWCHVLASDWLPASVRTHVDIHDSRVYDDYDDYGSPAGLDFGYESY